jgi:hypothetical protein
MEDLDAREGFKPPHTDDLDARHYAVRRPYDHLNKILGRESSFEVTDLGPRTFVRRVWTKRV